MDTASRLASLKDGMQGLARHLLDGAANLVFPPFCTGCGVRLGSPTGLCAPCWSSLHFIERPFCEVLGTPFAEDTGARRVSLPALADPPPFDHLRSAVVYGGVAARLVLGLKYHDRTELAPMMGLWLCRAGRELLADADLILAVPLHRRRLLVRRYNQSAELARAVSKLSGVPFASSVVIRRKPTRPQVGLGEKARHDNVRAAFAISPGKHDRIFGRKLVVIDDVYTTGATLAAISRLLKRHGAARVDVLTFARALPDPI